MSFAYRYEREDGRPLTRCPECGGPLCGEEGDVDIEFYDDGRGN